MHSAVQYGHPMLHREHPAKIAVLPMCNMTVDCYDIPGPCLQTLNSCNLCSRDLILNITPQKSRCVMSRDQAETAHLLGRHFILGKM